MGNKFERDPLMEKNETGGNEEELEGREKKIDLEKSSEKVEGRDDLIELAEKRIDELCEQYDDTEERVDFLMAKMEFLFKHIDKEILPKEKIEEIKNKLDLCRSTSKENFKENAMEALIPITDVKKNNPDKFEEAQARAFNETSGFTEINRLLSYGKSGSVIHVHAPPGETVKNKTALYLGGIRELARIVQNDPDIKEITATSFLVAKHQRLFEKAGFNVENVSEERKEKHFSGEERDVKHASIGREDFLEKWLKQ